MVYPKTFILKKDNSKNGEDDKRVDLFYNF